MPLFNWNRKRKLINAVKDGDVVAVNKLLKKVDWREVDWGEEKKSELVEALVEFIYKTKKSLRAADADVSDPSDLSPAGCKQSLSEVGKILSRNKGLVEDLEKALTDFANINGVDEYEFAGQSRTHEKEMAKITHTNVDCYRLQTAIKLLNKLEGKLPELRKEVADELSAKSSPKKPKVATAIMSTMNRSLPKAPEANGPHNAG